MVGKKNNTRRKLARNINNKTKSILERVRRFVLNTKSSNTVYALVITPSGDIKRVPYKNIVQNKNISTSRSSTLKNKTPTKLRPIKEQFNRTIKDNI